MSQYVGSPRDPVPDLMHLAQRIKRQKLDTAKWRLGMLSGRLVLIPVSAKNANLL